MRLAIPTAIAAAALAFSPSIHVMAAEGHDHAHDHGHDAAGGHGHHGPAHGLGSVTIGETSLKVTLMGEADPGHEAVIEITVAGGPAPSELRAWVGVKNGRGSVKALLPKEGDGYHGHLEVPTELPADSAVWIEAVTDAGRARASVALPAEGHEEEGHEHKRADEPGHEGHDHSQGDAKEKGHGEAGHDHDHGKHDHAGHGHEH